MKLLIEEALRRAGNASKLHRALVRHGCNVNYTLITNAVKRNASKLQDDVLVAIVDEYFGGDANEAFKLIRKNVKNKQKDSSE